jgi:uracil-DNA glycosylase
MSVEELVGLVGSYSGPDVFNPWRDGDPLDDRDGPGNRRIRLFQHFDCEPTFLLIGEAPGYQGCHFSGVPFTNEKLILDGVVPRVTRRQRITSRPRPWSEPSATIVWRVLHALGVAERTVMWNAFAWHPHKAGEPMSNRRPTQTELVGGLSVVRAVLSHFSAARVVAVGRVAEVTLKRLSIPFDAAIRHPSMGGATEFEAGMRKLDAGIFV